MTATYTWIVTRDAGVGDSSDAIGKIGPSGNPAAYRFDQVICEGQHFRLLNERNESEFEGYILGEFFGFEPLEDFGREFGCVAIEYEREGAWFLMDGTPHGPVAA